MTSPQTVRDARRSVLLLGLATVIAQALLLREAMAAMGGSELAWGVVMALWLAGVAAGARGGASFGSAATARWMPTAVMVLAAVGVVVLRAAPALAGAAPGEALTTTSAMWVWLAAIVPAAAAGGLAFPILAAELGAAGGGRAYALEAAGALVGGLGLAVALAFVGTAACLSVATGMLVALEVGRRRPAAAALIAAAALVLAVPAGDWLAQAGWRWSGRPGELRAWRETRHQQLAVADGSPTALYADGRLLASYPDPWSVLPRAHLLMLLHPEPRRVLAVGCAADGSVEAMHRHPIEHLRVVEDDPQLLASLPQWYGASMTSTLASPRVEAVASDPGRAVARGGPWDLVLLLDGDPTTLRRNRTRTLEFLESCRSHMTDDGILVLRVGVPDTYLGGAGGRLLAILAATLGRVFEQVAVIPGPEVLLVAGGPTAALSLEPEVLSGRLAARGMEQAELIREMIPLLVDPARARDLAGLLDPDAPPNTVRHPRAVLLAGGLHEGRSRTRLVDLVQAAEAAGAAAPAVGLAVAVGALLVLALRRGTRASAAAAVVGFCSMGWWLLLLAAWQASRGSVYSEVGALTAVFMAGLAAGGAAASRWTEPARHLPALLAGGSVLSVALAAGAGVRAPVVVVPVLLAAAGLLTGLAFPGLASLGGHPARRGTGIAFAADEAGAAAAALVIGIFILPWVGVAAAAGGLAVLELAALPAVAAVLRTAEGH